MVYEQLFHQRGDVTATIPAQGFQVLEGSDKKFTVTAFHLGLTVEPLYRHYFQGCHGILFVVDATSGSQLSKATAELHKYMQLPELASTRLLVIANMHDLKHACDATSIAERMRLQDLRQRWHVQPCVVSRRDDARVSEGLNWLHDATRSSQEKCTVL